MVHSGEVGFSMEITSYSPVASVIAIYCLMTIGINIFVCYYIYRKRSLRTSCTALIVANLAAVDVRNLEAGTSHLVRELGKAGKSQGTFI